MIKKVNYFDGRPIVLIGFMGSGKSVLGARVARKLGLKFLDLDAELVRLKRRSIQQLFERLGEEGFRRLETQVLRKSLRAGRLCAAGGGVVTQTRNRALLKRALVIWIDPSWNELCKRLRKHNPRKRPLLWDSAKGCPKSQFQVKGLWKARRELYAKSADVRLRVRPDENVSKSARSLVALLFRET